jgi:5-hydroxyisourate hydrolase
MRSRCWSDEPTWVVSVTLSTHVLDAALGRPAAGVPVALFRLAADGWSPAGSGETDRDGRLADLPSAGSALEAGVWQLRFDTGHYFRGTDQRGFYPEVSVTFEVTDASSHHHVPLLLSPFAYSTYRGS